MIRTALIAIALPCLCEVAALSAADSTPGRFEHHPDIRIELFAAEPDVVDPVSLTFAANGDCYVVEMRDYPYGVGTDRKPGGTIRLLRDRDRDGRVDESHLFATGLGFPTSVLAWRDGILVVAPPEIRFLRDTNGDDQADVNQVVVTGLRRGVTDSNANGLRWGVDNLVHVVNGGNGGKVKLAGSEQPALSLGNSDFAIDMKAKQIFKTVRTGGGFGLVFDDFGHSFTTHNLDYLQQRIIPTRYIERSPEMYSFKATENVSDHGVSARIYPIVQAVTRVNHPEQAGRFSSAGGMGILNSKLYSPRLANSIFVCDVVCNLVHRDVLRDDGPVFRAGRAPEEQDREFIASRDPSFRPVGLEPGPDGALYLIDMQRDVIEHPDYIPARVREGLDIRAGDQRGRIYRVLPQQGLPNDLRPLAAASAVQLVKTLAATSRWHRDTAHRLLADRADQETTRLLSDCSRNSESAVARIHALWLLDHLNPASTTSARFALNDQDARVREQAIQILENHQPFDPETLAAVVERITDPDPRVRFQASLAVDGIAAAGKRQRILDSLLIDWRHKWSRRALLMSIDQDARWLLSELWKSKSFQMLPNNDDKLELLRELAEVAAATATDEGESFASWLRQLGNQAIDAPLASALLSGLSAGWQRRPSSRLSDDQIAAVVQAWTADDHQRIAPSLLDLIALHDLPVPASMQTLFAQSRQTAIDSDLAAEFRVSAIAVLARDSSDESFEVLIDLLAAPESTAIQGAAIEAIAKQQRPDAGARLLQIWSAILPGIRVNVIELLLSRRGYHNDIVTALETGTVDFSELNLDLEQRRRLLRWSTRDIAERARKWFGDEEYSNRKAIVSQWLVQLPDKGNAAEGSKLFAQKCATCHVVGDTGHRVGPDLQALSHRSVEDLLTHILDPNMSINPNYVTCVVETTAGQIVNGLLAEETAESITLKQAEGKLVTIDRAEIEQLKTLKTSLMPEGLEKELTPLQLRSLIAYLQEN